MSNEEKEILDSETQDNGGDDVTTDEVEDTSSENTDYEAQIEAERKKFEDQRRRAEKAEEELKKLRSSKEDTKPESKPESQDAPASSLTKEEAILYARGLSESEVEKVKAIAKIEGESPLVAAESDYFKIWREKQTKDQEAQDTQLGASKGSVKTKPKKSFTDNLSKSEHEALWKKHMGR